LLLQVAVAVALVMPVAVAQEVIEQHQVFQYLQDLLLLSR
jgi:hypothetical protein